MPVARVLRSKGTILNVGAGGGVGLGVAQLLSIKYSGGKSETFEADTLDNTEPGIPKKPTGRVEGGSVSGDLYYSSAAAAAFYGPMLAPPAAGADGPSCSISFAGGGGMTFRAAGFGFGFSVELKDGVKGDYSIELDGAPTFS